MIQERLKHCKFGLIACTNNVKLFCDTCEGGDNFDSFEPEVKRRKDKQQQNQHGGIHGRNNSDY